MLFDHHIHSKYSRLDSMSEIEDILAVAKASGMGGIAISDHDTIEGSLKAAKASSKELIVIPSIEVGSIDGHIVCLGITEGIDRELPAKEVIKKAHDLGGIVIAAHPYDTFRRGVGDLCWKLDFDAIEINGHCLHGNGKAENAAKKHKKPLVGGSDAHALSGIGAICTEIEAKTAEEIIENIKAGKTKVVYKRNPVSLKTSIITDSISRKYHMHRKL